MKHHLKNEKVREMRRSRKGEGTRRERNKRREGGEEGGRHTEKKKKSRNQKSLVEGN